MAEANSNSRLEAFCDGVFAFAITPLIIDIKIPGSTTINTTADFWNALQHLCKWILAAHRGCDFYPDYGDLDLPVDPWN